MIAQKAKIAIYLNEKFLNPFYAYYASVKILPFSFWFWLWGFRTYHLILKQDFGLRLVNIKWFNSIQSLAGFTIALWYNLLVYLPAQLPSLLFDGSCNISYWPYYGSLRSWDIKAPPDRQQNKKINCIELYWCIPLFTNTNRNHLHIIGDRDRDIIYVLCTCTTCI